MSSRNGLLIGALATLIALPAFVFGQARDTASLSGIIVDAQGAAVPLAKVTITSVTTAAARSLVTDQSGNYLFSLLPVGVYTLTVELTGFRKYQRTNLLLQANENIHADVTMDVGNVSESVTVESNAAQVDTTYSNLDSTVASKIVFDMPLLCRHT